MLDGLRTTSKTLMRCENRKCEQYGREKVIRWLNDSYYEPGEWLDETECEECGEELVEIGDTYTHPSGRVVRAALEGVQMDALHNQLRAYSVEPKSQALLALEARLDNLYDALTVGLPSQRERIATAVLTGLLAAGQHEHDTFPECAEYAVKVADALIAALEESP